MEDKIDEVVRRFQRVYVGDRLLERIELDLAAARCTFILNSASVLKHGPSPSIFDPEQVYEPARLSFAAVRSVSCPDGGYYLNGTIVSFGAEPAGDANYVRFRFEMTGGFSNETFMRALVIEAEDFSLGQDG